MRITNNMMANNFKINVFNNLESLSKQQNMVSTGKKVSVPSDDPIVVARSLRLRAEIGGLEQYKKNSEDADSWLSLTEETLGQIGDYLQKAKELAVQAANGTLAEDDKQSIKFEITHLKEGIVDLLNTSYAGRYIFAGYETNEKPFELIDTDVGTKLTYQGKIFNPLGSISSAISDADFETYYNNNVSNIYGQAEIKRANFTPFTAAAPSLNFDLTIDGTPYTISLTDGFTYDSSNIVTELQNEIDTTIGANELEVSLDGEKLTFTAVNSDISTIEINESAAGALDLNLLGFVDGFSSDINNNQKIEYEVSVGTKIDVNIEGNDVIGESVNNIIDVFNRFELALDGAETCKSATVTGGVFTVTEDDISLTNSIDEINDCLLNVLNNRIIVGEKNKFTEMMIERINDDILNFTELLSKNEDVDMAEAIIDLETQEVVYNASLQVGAKVIQQTLVDFIK
jgi:flagellar hook-associated protein 3 FlgL